MSVLLVRRGSIENVDGVSTYILEIAQELLKRGINTHILCGTLNRRGEELEEYLKQAFGVEKVPNISAVLEEGKANYYYLFTPLPWLKAINKLSSEFEVIHTNNFIPLPPSRHRKIATCHGSEGIVKVEGVKRIVYRVNVNLTAPIYGKIIAVSEDLKKQLKDILLPPFRKKLIVLPVGININRYKRSSGKREDAVLHMGTSPRKNLQATLKAMKLLWRTNPGARLYITGAKNNYVRKCVSVLEDKWRKNIYFTGLLDKKSLIDLMSRVKIAVFPSYCEALPIAVLENMCSGTPVIVSRTVPDILVRHGVNGFKIRDPNDYKSLAHYILRLISDIDLWKNMSYKGKSICEEFDIRKIVNKLLVIYGLQ